MIFLGAGASAPFGIPTSATLTTEICDLLKKNHSNLLNDITEFWKGCYDNKEPNYENILEFLMGLTDSRKISKDSLVRAFTKDHREYKKNYTQIIDNVYSKIIDYCTLQFKENSTNNKPKDLEIIFRKTWDIFTLLRDELIFTTNYDPSIEIWCQKRNIKLYDGTEITNNPEIKKYPLLNEETIKSGSTNFPESKNNPSSLKIIRLHGSVWDYEASNNKIKFNQPSDKRLFNDLYLHFSKRPTIIFPGQESVLDSGVWDIRYQYFKRMLKKNCLVIGYSFNDNLINKVFIENLKNYSLRKIGIVNPKPNEAINNLFWKEDNIPKEKIISIPVEFGTDHAVQQIYYKWIQTIKGFNYGSGVTHKILDNVRKMKSYIE